LTPALSESFLEYFGLFFLRMKGSLVGHQFNDQPCALRSRCLVKDLIPYSTVPGNCLVDLNALLTHLTPSCQNGATDIGRLNVKTP
jgi:hypothetical protein